MANLDLAFPDQSYSTSNKPSTDTLKSDLSAIEDAHNDQESTVNDHEGRIDALEPDVAELQTGWLTAGESWTFNAVDDPTGVINVPSNATLKYSVGMRIRFVNGGNTIYGIITAVAATTITFCHEIDPSDDLAINLLANSAITLPYYSHVKNPFGFPSAKQKWSIIKPFTLGDAQLSPVTGTWYNLGTPKITLPIGSWDVEWWAGVRVAAGGSSYVANVTLSTANNSESDAEMTAGVSVNAPANGNSVWLSKHKTITVAVKTDEFLNFQSNTSTPTSQAWNERQMIRAVLAYL